MRSTASDRVHARGDKVTGIDELIPVVAAADDPYLSAFVYKIEQDRKQTKTALVDDRRTSENYDIHVVLEFVEDLFTFPFRFSVYLDRIGHVVFENRTMKILCPEAVRRDKHHLWNFILLAVLSDVAGAVD